MWLHQLPVSALFKAPVLPAARQVGENGPIRRQACRGSRFNGGIAREAAPRARLAFLCGRQGRIAGWFSWEISPSCSCTLQPQCSTVLPGVQRCNLGSSGSLLQGNNAVSFSLASPLGALGALLQAKVKPEQCLPLGACRSDGPGGSGTQLDTCVT